VLVYPNEYLRAVRQKKIDVRVAGIERFTECGAMLSNGDKVAADFVVLATGWRLQMPFLDGELCAALRGSPDGQHLFRNILSPHVPGVAFVYSATTTFKSLLTMALQVRTLASTALMCALRRPGILRMQCVCPADAAHMLQRASAAVACWTARTAATRAAKASTVN
jgi:hypothetical protein